MKRNLLVLAAVMGFAFLALGAVGHTSAQGPTGTPTASSSTVAPSVDNEPLSAVDTDTAQDAVGAQIGGQVVSRHTLSRQVTHQGIGVSEVNEELA